MALLHLLHDWGRVPLAAVTVDHGLRPNSAGEAAHVAAICDGLGIPHSVLKWQGWDGRGNLQDQARRTRYSMMADWAREAGLSAVALGHTQDDQAETFLLRLSRQAGLEGLSAMRPRVTHYGMAFDRPMLALARNDLRTYLTERGVRWVEDPSNEDAAFERVRVRQALEVLATLGLDTASVATSVKYLQDADEALAVVTSRYAEDKVTAVAGDLIFDRTDLRRQPHDIMRRLLAGGLRWVASADYAPRKAPLAEAMNQVIEGENTALHGCRVLVSGMTVRITRELAAVSGMVTPTDQPWDGRWRLDGPHAPDLEVRALGEAVNECPNWRETGLPRASLLSSPAVWRGDRLVAAPVAGLNNGWTAQTRDAGDFATSLIVH